MNPHDRGVYQDAHGTSYDAQNTNRIMDLANLGGYTTKNGSVLKLNGNVLVESIFETKQYNTKTVYYGDSEIKTYDTYEVLKESRYLNLSDVDKANSWVSLAMEGSNSIFGIEKLLSRGKNVVDGGYYEALVNGKKFYIKQGAKTFQNYNLGKANLAAAEAQYLTEAANAAKLGSGLKFAGKGLGYAGVLFSGYNLVENPDSPKAKADFGFSAAGFIPLVGWAISGTYFLADLLFPEETQITVESINAGMEARRKYAQDPMNAVVCFKEGTIVLVDSGSVKIENIVVGDSVLSYNLTTNTISTSRVVNVSKRSSISYYTLKTTTQTIYVTSEHPFYVNKKGWVKLKDLKVGDECKTKNGLEVVISLDENLVPTDVYNIEVEQNHNYFVTTSGILVHNKKIMKKKLKFIRKR